MQDLDLRSLFFLLLTRIKWIILAVAVGMIAFGSYAKFILPEEYTSSAMLYMINLEEDANTQVATNGNLVASERLVKTVRTATTAPWALQEASDRLNGALSPSTLSSLITFSLVEETSFLRLSVTYTDPKLTRLACDAVAETAVVAFAATGEAGNARVYQPAVTASKTSPNVLRFVLMGATFGFVVAVVVIVASTIFSTTVYDKDDIQRRLNVAVLGEIPSFKPKTKGGNRNHG